MSPHVDKRIEQDAIGHPLEGKVPGCSTELSTSGAKTTECDEEPNGTAVQNW